MITYAYTPVSEETAEFQQARRRMLRLILKLAVKLRISERKKFYVSENFCVYKLYEFSVGEIPVQGASSTISFVITLLN